MIETIKKASIQARKNKSTTAAFLSTLLSDCQMVAKNAGKESPSNDECIAVIKKHLKGVNEFLSKIDESSDRYHPLTTEKNLLEGLLPQQMPLEQLKSTLEGFKSSGQYPTMGEALKALKSASGGLYDGAMAAKLAKEIYA